MELERWRAQLEAIPATLARDCYTYRQGVRFGLVKPVPQKVEFYFEKISKAESTRCAEVI